jgi:hydrogenase maturation protein HypF
MFADLEQLRAHCEASAAEAALLLSPEHPIVLLEWREAGGGAVPAVHEEVAIGQRYLGAMLPYTPLHILLLHEAGRPLVMTSGNLAEEPIVKGWEEIDRLAPIADAYLVHDREIAVRYDDSVAQVSHGRPRLIRRSRGYAPFPVALPRPLPQTLACGAELKNTFCLTRDANAFVSQHIGDLENLETLEHYEAAIKVYQHLFRLDPEVVAHDLHPEYLATKHALSLPQELKVAVQHHHAHVAARMVEHGREDPVIGVSLDGLGYGDDGVLWGGEVLVCDLLGYRRVAHLEELPLPGGATAIARPWRTALGWSYALLGDEGFERAARALLVRAAGSGAGLGATGQAPTGPSDETLEAVRAQIDGGVNTPLTTSCGRLFDAVAALAGVRHEISYEGQAAIELEMRSMGARGGGAVGTVRAAADTAAAPYPYLIEGDAAEAAPAPRRSADEAAGGPAPAVVRLAPLFDGVLSDVEAGAPAGAIGARLHETMSALVLDLCRSARGATRVTAVALTGGVYQNRLLASLCESALAADGFDVLAAGLVPTNDGGVSLGQAAVAGYTVLKRRGDLA